MISVRPALTPAERRNCEERLRSLSTTAGHPAVEFIHGPRGVAAIHPTGDGAEWYCRWWGRDEGGGGCVDDHAAAIAWACSTTGAEAAQPTLFEVA